MLFYGYQAFSLVPSLQKSPPPQIAKSLQILGPTRSHELVHHMIQEEKRSYFEDWELAELGLILALTVVLFLGVKSKLLTAFALAILVLAEFAHVKITPELGWVGSSIEFIPFGVESKQRDQFWNLHAIFIVLTCARLALGCTIGALLVKMHRSRRSGSKDERESRELKTVRSSAR